MVQDRGTFFTTLGCMDGRVQKPIAEYGRNKFAAKFPDTITEAGMDRVLANSIDERFLESIKKKILISVKKHNSQGIVVHGHQDCAGNPVDDLKHKEDIRASVEVIRSMIDGRGIDVIGVFVGLYPEIKVEEIE